MSEERLKEIKFSINLRINCYKEKDVNYLFANEALELYNEVIRLREENEKEKQFTKDCGFENQQQLALSYLDYKTRIDKAVEYIDSLWLDDKGTILKIKERLHCILRGEDNEL